MSRAQSVGPTVASSLPPPTLVPSTGRRARARVGEYAHSLRSESPSDLQWPPASPLEPQQPPLSAKHRAVPPLRPRPPPHIQLQFFSWRQPPFVFKADLLVTSGPQCRNATASQLSSSSAATRCSTQHHLGAINFIFGTWHRPPRIPARHSSSPQHPAPYRWPQVWLRRWRPSKRCSRREHLCFQYGGPALRILRATLWRCVSWRAGVWCCASCGPGSCTAHHSDWSLELRILRAGVWCCASCGLGFGAAPLAGHGLVLRSCGPRPGSCLSEVLPIASNEWVLATWRAAAGGAAYRKGSGACILWSHSLVWCPGSTVKKKGYVLAPAQGGRLGLLRVG
ncbi:ribosomal protein S27AE [Janthinobacterium sp. CG_23.3]